MKPPCSDKCRYSKKIQILNFSRFQIFEMYWVYLHYNVSVIFLNATVSVLLPVQRRLKVSAEYRNPNTYYSLISEGKSYTVCKTFLLNTLGISERTLRTVIENKSKALGVAPIDQRDKHGNQSKTDPEIINSVRNHVNSIARVENSYLRANTTREYIDGGL